MEYVDLDISRSVKFYSILLYFKYNHPNMALDEVISRINNILDKEDESRNKKSSEDKDTSKKKTRYYVFSAADIPENKKVIELARLAMRNIRGKWEEMSEVAGYYPNVDSGEIAEGNIEIYMEGTRVSELIRCCMEYATEFTKLKCKNGMV